MPRKKRNSFGVEKPFYENDLNMLEVEINERIKKLIQQGVNVVYIINNYFLKNNLIMFSDDEIVHVDANTLYLMKDNLPTMKTKKNDYNVYNIVTNKVIGEIRDMREGITILLNPFGFLYCNYFILNTLVDSTQ